MLSLVSVGVELLLHELGVFHWHYWWWNAATFPVIVVFGYLTFYVVTFIVYDAPSRTDSWPSSARCGAGPGDGADLRADPGLDLSV